MTDRENRVSDGPPLTSETDIRCERPSADRQPEEASILEAILRIP